MSGNPPPVDLSTLFFTTTFYGDDRDSSMSLAFINELKRAAVVYDSSAHDRVIKIWAINLEADAAEWWSDGNVWSQKDKKDIEVVVTEFLKKWPGPETTKKKPHQLMEEFDRITLHDVDVGRIFLDDHGAELTYQLQFAKDLRKKAHAAGDSTNLMVKLAVRKFPPRLREAIGPTWTDILTWDELVTKVEAVSRARLEEVDAKMARDRDVDQRLRALSDKNTPANTTAVEPEAVAEQKPRSTTFATYSPRTVRSPYPRFPPTALPRSQPTTPRAQIRQQAAASSNPFLDVAPKTDKVIQLSHEDTPAGWRSFHYATRAWDEKWGTDTLPNAARPYPLQPGGVENGCWKCGKGGHYGRDCPAPEEDHVSNKEAHWRRSQLVSGGDHTPAQPRTPTQMRSRALFATPPASVNTPSPAFNRMRPPHLAATAGGIFALYDAEGIYVGDSDGGYTHQDDWEDGYAAGMRDAYQGNGDGSGAF